MHFGLKSVVAFGLLCAIGIFCNTPSHAQGLALKSNESVEVAPVYWVANCKSILKSFAGIDILAGPPEVTLKIKEGKVFARRQNCSKPVQGGTVIATVKDVKVPTKATLTYRVRYKTLDGDRQSSHTFELSLFP